MRVFLKIQVPGPMKTWKKKDKRRLQKWICIIPLDSVIFIKYIKYWALYTFSLKNRELIYTLMYYLIDEVVWKRNERKEGSNIKFCLVFLLSKLFCLNLLIRKLKQKRIPKCKSPKSHCQIKRNLQSVLQSHCCLGKLWFKFVTITNENIFLQSFEISQLVLSILSPFKKLWAELCF